MKKLLRWTTVVLLFLFGSLAGFGVVAALKVGAQKAAERAAHDLYVP